MIVDDDVGDGLEDEAYDPYTDPMGMAGTVPADPAAGAGNVAVVGRRRRRGVGGGWVSLLLVGAAGVAAVGAFSALAVGSPWGVIVNVVAALLCVVGALVERGVTGARPVGTPAMRIGHYARLALVVVVLVAVVRYGAQEEGGLDAVGWHVPAAILAAAVFVQWWRDPQRMS